MAWRLLHRIDRGLFAQLIIVPLLSRYRVLTQVAGHNMDVIKILPPLNITEKEVNYFVDAFDKALAGCRRFPGPILELARNTALKNGKRAKRGVVQDVPGFWGAGDGGHSMH